ncbi:hypothetical protein EJB05_11624, partial [Eragrostis curvula]
MRLSLSRISVAQMYYKGTQPFHALEVIRLHFVSLTQAAFGKMMGLCPNLRTLDLRGCDCSRLTLLPANLRRVTIAECIGTAYLNRAYIPRLQSFLYSGSLYSSGFLEEPFILPRDAILFDLYICLSDSISGCYLIRQFNRSLPDDLSGLTVLTICSNALPAASPLPDDEATDQSTKLINLHSLRELQLLMLEMMAENLADIYVFFETCQCANLERLFAHLPKSNYEPVEASLDEVEEEPPKIDLDNLKMVKVMNFKWHCTEVQLVSFLLRKATSLQKLLLVSPNVAPLDAPSFIEADLLLLKEALANGKIMLSESEDSATQPYHSEIFIKV